jgi:tRNA dimethylallyltransferase
MLLAEEMGGEIISCDSMQVYRGLDTGTAKPSQGDRARIPHHLIDIVDLTEEFDAAKFTQLARKAVTQIQSRGRVPILCGGTGLYFRAFLEGLGTTPPADLVMRATLEATPLPELLRELAELDPVTYQTIDRQNPRRVIRAVEVIRLSGKPFSEQRAAWNAEGGVSPQLHGFGAAGTEESVDSFGGQFFGLCRSTEDLRNRIGQRVDGMFGRGLVEETHALLKRGLAENRTAMQALGYRQVVEHLRGERSLAETIELVKVRTRQFAKRQMTWFKKQPGLKWISLQPDESPAAVIEKIER